MDVYFVTTSISSIEENYGRETKKLSPAGNRTPVSRVTGGDTHHYTTEDVMVYWKYFKNKPRVLTVKLQKVRVQHFLSSF